jgi:peptidoglycan/LPS O-acetylase OafA/YrhL
VSNTVDEVGTPASEAKPPNERLDSLTGMRFAAAFVVFGFHLLAFFYLTSALSSTDRVFAQGTSGVSFFFILSGFVLTWSHQAGDRAVSFYRRRAAKILPLHILTWLIVGVLVVWFAERPSTHSAIASLVLLAPWTPHSANHLTMNTPSWSLGCEAFFYLLFPFILPILLRLGVTLRRLAIAGLVVLVLAIALAARIHGTTPTVNWALYFFPPTRLIEFVLGMILALEVRAGRLPHIPLLGATFLALAVYIADGWASTAFQPIAVTLIPYALLIVAGAQADRQGLASFWRKATIVRLGAWSFAFYLIHWSVLVFLEHFENGVLSNFTTAWVGLAAFAMTLTASGILYTFFEHPIELRLRGTRRPPADDVGRLHH